MLDTVEINPNSAPVGTVIWLHGLGADGHDFEPIVPELRLTNELPLRFVFPHAPQIPVTLNGGMRMRAWFDVLSLDREGRQDEEGIRASGRALEALISRELERGISLSKIVLAGFSQGGAVAVFTTVRYPADLAGLMALSTYVPMAAALKAEHSGRNLDTPFMVAHGQFDPVLPLEFGEQVHVTLSELGHKSEFKSYPMPHSVCPEEIADIRAFLLRCYGVAA
ncbi:MAG: carboxylesterase [Pseudomonadota bacterium]